MSINRVKTTEGEQSFNFLTNQSSILHTVDTNKITINGVNVIVDKPKRGDVMCITKYKKENGELLEADKQRVVWIDGLSIEPTQLSSELEPVGICIVVKGNKALVRYREETKMRWATSDRFELQNESIMSDGAEHTCTITLNRVENPNKFIFIASSRAEFVEKLNAWFLAHNNNYSVELVELNTDLPATDTSDTKDGDSYRNRIIVNTRFIGENSHNTFWIEPRIGGGTRTTGKHINESNWYYMNSWKKINGAIGCCRAKYYDAFVNSTKTPSRPVFPIQGQNPFGLTTFTSNENCQLLRDTFATYDEYVESFLIKFPCGAGGAITEFPCGKENTYKLADCTFLDNATGKQEVLYPAANWAASINLNAPKLGKGNWWLPSVAEMVEIMRDITYGTSFQETKPDIINTVLLKLTSISNNGWSMLDINERRWTSSLNCASTSSSVYVYSGDYGYIKSFISSNLLTVVSPITIYEF